MISTHYLKVTRGRRAASVTAPVRQKASLPDAAEHDLMAMAAATIAPSDRPAAELPDVEPGLAELLAIEMCSEITINDLLAAANTFSAYEASRHDQLGLPAALVQPGAVASGPVQTTLMERAA